MEHKNSREETEAAGGPGHDGDVKGWDEETNDQKRK